MMSVVETPEMIKEKRIMLVAMLLNVFSCMCLFMNVASLLPTFVLENHTPPLNDTYVGILMAVFPIGFLLAAPLIGQYMEVIGRKNILYIGVFMMTLATLTFGLASYATNAWMFYGISTFARFFQGIANASINVTTPSITAQEFPKQKTIYLGYCNMALGLGCAIGPVLGSLVYTLCQSYVQTFYFFTAFIFVVGTVCVSFVPSRINKKAAGLVLVPATENIPAVANPYRQSITYFTILRNRRALSTIIMCVYAMTASQVVVPVLSVRLTTPPFNMSDAGAGYAFGLMGGAQALGAPFAGWMGTQMPIKWVSQIGCCALIFAFFFSGPSLYF